MSKKTLLTEKDRNRLMQLAGLRPKRSLYEAVEGFPPEEEDEDPFGGGTAAPPGGSGLPPGDRGPGGDEMGGEEDPLAGLGDDDFSDDSMDAPLDDPGSPSVDVAADPLVDQIVALVSKGIRDALSAAKQSGELDISTATPEDVPGSNLDPKPDDSTSALPPVADDSETDDTTLPPDEEKLNEIAPLPSADKEKQYRDLEEALFERLRESRQFRQLKASVTNPKLPTKTTQKKK